jgi:ParB family chromosome partitioning protein
VLEQRARQSNAGPRVARQGRAPLHPDQEAAATEIAEALGAALGTDVRVRPRGTGYKVELAFDTVDDAVALAARVRASAVA